VIRPFDGLPQIPVNYDELSGFSEVWGGDRMDFGQWTIPWGAFATLPQFQREGAIALMLAAILDYAIGDPWTWLHPVQVMGWVIQRYSKWVLTIWKAPRCQRLAGIELVILLVGGSGAIACGLVALGDRIHPVLGWAVQGVLLASCLAGRSLRHAAEDVLRPLAAGDLVAARQCLSRYVGRDTEALPEPEILRAVLETVTENATDGVMAPLFWAIAGGLTPLGVVGGAIAYKAASTLDSMVGYRDAPYTYIGWASARCDDVLTWLPCRLTVLTIALLSGRPGHVLRVCRRDAPQDPSPNAGWSECAYAAALGVQVGGLNLYRGLPKPKPLLGNPDHPITPAIIRRAMALTRTTFLLWLGLAVGLILIAGG